MRHGHSLRWGCHAAEERHTAQQRQYAILAARQGPGSCRPVPQGDAAGRARGAEGSGGRRVRAALPPGRRSAARRSRWHAPARCGRSSLLGAARHRRLAASPCVEGSGIGTVRNCPCRERHEQERECDACSRKQPRYTACHGATDRSGERTRPHAPASAHRGRGRRHRRRRPRCRPIRPRPRARCGRGCRGLQTVDTLSTYPH